jgi:hypothetical protein
MNKRVMAVYKQIVLKILGIANTLRISKLCGPMSWPLCALSPHVRRCGLQAFICTAIVSEAVALT